jgi:hypothetical protein
MCATCGCAQPEENHDDPRNIVWSQVVAAGEAAGISPTQAAVHIMDMAEKHATSERSDLLG